MGEAEVEGRRGGRKRKSSSFSCFVVGDWAGLWEVGGRWGNGGRGTFGTGASAGWEIS